MRCESCGKEVADFVMDYRGVGSNRHMSGSPTTFVPRYVCRRCASYRRQTYRLFWWIIGAAAAFCLIIILLDAVLH
jgi:hypothetical protein